MKISDTESYLIMGMCFFNVMSTFILLSWFIQEVLPKLWCHKSCLYWNFVFAQPVWGSLLHGTKVNKSVQVWKRFYIGLYSIYIKISLFIQFPWSQCLRQAWDGEKTHWLWGLIISYQALNNQNQVFNTVRIIKDVFIDFSRYSILVR